MVFKFSQLARHSFAKSFSHGYAQSIAAASQSSHAASTTPLSLAHHRFTRPNQPNRSEAFQNALQAARSSTSTVVTHTTEKDHASALNEYFAAWQRRKDGEHEWQQFQFPKRIGWKETAAQPEVEIPAVPEAKEVVRPVSDTTVTTSAPAVGRSQSESATQSVLKIDTDIAEAQALARVDRAIAEEIFDIQQSASQEKQIAAKDAATVDTPTADSIRSSTPARTSTPSSAFFDSKTTTPPQPSVVEQYTAKIVEFQNANEYTEIPPLFEFALSQGLVLPARAYNALLQSAIVLPAGKHAAIAKALVVYSNMLSQNVAPDTTTYTILLELFSRRTLQVLDLRRESAEKLARFSTNGEFLLPSHELEHLILAEDKSLDDALRMFNVATSGSFGHRFRPETYDVLIRACAESGNVEQMIKIFEHAEMNGVTSVGKMYPSMILAFARQGNLRSAIECYNGYKELAISSDNGRESIIGRADEEVYSAVVRSYAMCGRWEGAERFLEKIAASFNPDQMVKFEATKRAVYEGVVAERIAGNEFERALKIAMDQDIATAAGAEAVMQVGVKAADASYASIANEAYMILTGNGFHAPQISVALLALYIREGNLSSARAVWSELEPYLHKSGVEEMVEVTTLYSTALISNGAVDEGLMQARLAFNGIRSSMESSPASTHARKELAEQIGQAVEHIGYFMVQKGIKPTPQASMSFMSTMVASGGVVPPVAEYLLASLGPDAVTNFSLQDLKLALQVQAGILSNGVATLDVAHAQRFAHLLETCIARKMPLDTQMVDMVGSALSKIAHQRRDLAGQWHAYLNPQAQFIPLASPVVTRPATPRFNDTYDPYAAKCDHRGSSMIVDELDKAGNKAAHALNEALLRFHNIRRAGRCPRYIAYAKLITAAAKDGREKLMHEIVGYATTDMPLIDLFSVKHGWASIFDACIGASLTLNNRPQAAAYHQQLLQLGHKPTANTYGLYITTLASTTKTFDEATEAVKIFHRALKEGVEPSSFLYNALIGKLGKARRIDDVLLYFSQMQQRGIRPTSVTYGTIINALCRVSDERFATELFDEMESQPNYKPRPAPYNSMMQFYLGTKRDSAKVLEYYSRMQARNIQPTAHTFKLLIDTHATLEPISMLKAEGILLQMRSSGVRPEAIHYASLIHAKGCVQGDMPAARALFDTITAPGNSEGFKPAACLYQSLFESMVANHQVTSTPPLLSQMQNSGIGLTAYIANALIHGWAGMEKDIVKAQEIFDALGLEKREPSTYEAMVRGCLACGERERARQVVNEMLGRAYPAAVTGKVCELLGNE